MGRAWEGEVGTFFGAWEKRERRGRKRLDLQPRLLRDGEKKKCKEEEEEERGRGDGQKWGKRRRRRRR